jgi:hypothetical protein
MSQVSKAFENGELVIRVPATPEILEMAEVAASGKSRTIAREQWVKVSTPLHPKPFTVMLHVAAPLAG